jgi:hypothetical protein
MSSCLRRTLSLLFVLLSLPLFAQSDNDKLTQTILHQDALFWESYNHCDIAKMPEFFTHDVEFYHDKGGITLGSEALVGSVEKNLCSNPDYHLRREAVEGSLQVSPLRNGKVIYGAVLSGEHYFYINEKGKPEYRDGLARFFHVWLLKDGSWKMARIISYDHGPAPSENKH